MVITWKFVFIPNRSFGRLLYPFTLFQVCLCHINIYPKSVIRLTLISFLAFFMSVYAISAFLSASCPHPCLAVARYAFDKDAANLLETNTNLP